MPLFNRNTAPKISRESQEEIKIYDSLVWEIDGKKHGIDSGYIYENADGHGILVMRVILPEGAFSKRVSQVRWADERGNVEWYTVDSSGPNFDILIKNLGNGEHQTMTPSEFRKWFGGKPPRSIMRAPEVISPELEKYQKVLVEAAKRRKAEELTNMKMDEKKSDTSRSRK